MEPYEVALEWIKAEGLSKQYWGSEVPEKRNTWAEFKEQDPEGMGMLHEIETNKCPALVAQASGQGVADQVFTPVS